MRTHLDLVKRCTAESRNDPEGSDSSSVRELVSKWETIGYVADILLVVSNGEWIQNICKVFNLFACLMKDHYHSGAMTSSGCCGVYSSVKMKLRMRQVR